MECGGSTPLCFSHGENLNSSAMPDWPHGPTHRLDTVGAYMVTAATYYKRPLFNSAKRLAFRQQKPVHFLARAAGVQEGDVIAGIDGPILEMTMLEFLAHVRKNYLVGDRITLNVIRGDKRLDLPLTLR